MARRTVKDGQIHLRVTAEQKRVLSSAAAAAGLSLSSWLLALALQNVRRRSHA
jgi:uncharacterized protein (DUF1778 family)